MANDIDGPKSVIIKGSEPQGLRQGDDIPLRETDVAKVTDQSPQPISIELMAKYLRNLTEHPIGSRPNAYPIKDSYSIVKTHNEDGSPAALITPSDDAANVFASAFDPDVVAAIAGEMFDAETLRKLRDPKTGYHELLRTIVSNEGGRNPEVDTPSSAPEVQKQVSNILKKNRFNPNPGKTPFLPLATATSGLDDRPIGTVQGTLGQYSTTQGQPITYEQMKKIGLALMLRATGEAIDGDPTDFGTQLAATGLPGLAQITASKVINRKRMWPSTLSTNQGKPEGMNSQVSSLDMTLDDGENSYGNLNSFAEPFGGLNATGMVVLGAALVLAVKLLSEAFQLLFAAISPPSLSGDASVAPSPDGAIRTPGSSRYEPLSTSENVAGLFGFTPTVHNYSEAFDRGVDVFFGFNGASDAAGGFARVAQSPGYYVVMVREIIRSGGKIVTSITDAFSSGNPLEAVQSLLGLVDVIRSSKITAYFNIVARLGDILLTLEDEGLIPEDSVGLLSEPGALPNKGKFSTIDRLVSNAASRVMKNRVSENDATLAWKTSATPSVYLLPGAILSAADYMPDVAKVDNTTLSDVPDDILEQITAEVTSGRLSPDIVKLMEAQLDSEYVPFYFHDLRTNEIVSFHAFLSACTDSFAANWNSENYYGRVDPVRIYSHTERSISLSFIVAATNPNDFDVMWWKINKLVTMLYPQWSKGRKLVVEKDKNEFIQPFSQVPTSSPVIRLRLGDVFTSNYSKFALARLFGLGTDDFVINNEHVDKDRGKKLLDLSIAMSKEKKRILTKPLSAEDTDKFGYKKDYKAWLIPTKNFRVQPAFGSPVDTAIGPQQQPLKDITTEMLVTVKDVIPVQLANKKIEVTYLVELDTPPAGFIAGPYVVNFYQLRPDEKDIRKQVTTRKKDPVVDPETISDDVINSIRDFFSSDNNVITKSFESSMGRGLAGVITTMGFDWKTPTWDVSDLGRRAPQWCQITMTFMPIHDIAPGLDANGFNRAPVYNVGSVVRGVGSDPNPDGIELNKELYKQNHAEINKSRKK